ncbi:MAG TPA: hypothetical protein VFD55_00355 [Candidatus Angelobacter sp.]|nr:hypothetical protein [Candidatus Angelobacter sp.]
MNHADKRWKGFTLIELMLAMAFVSTLLVAIAMVVIQIGNIYNHGLTFKEVNQAGRSLASELQRSINQSPPFLIEGVNSRYIQQGDWGGRLCLGQYSYIWNYGKAIYYNDESNLNVYAGDDSSRQIRFVKVFDPNTSYCTETSKKIDPSNAVELVDVSQHDLAVHNFMISTKATAGDSKTGQQLYSIEFLIGTNNQNEQYDQAGLTYESGVAACKSPNEDGADPSYCSINQFNIVARAGNTIE